MTNQVRTTTRTVPRKEGQNVISSALEFQVRNEGRKRVETDYAATEDNELLQGRPGAAEGGLPRVHTSPERVTMYKPDGQGHYTPRSNIPVTAIAQNLTNGWYAHCPECGGDHGTDPNDCPAREPTLKRQCPVCGKVIYDNMDIVPTAPKPGADRDPLMIYDDAYSASTPETRTKVLLDTHIWAKHPQSARIMNLPPMAEPSQQMLDAIVGKVGATV